jgi:stage IV sporulation protein FB
MRDHSSAWSLNCGLWGGVRVQMHASLFVAGVLMVYLATLAGMPDHGAANVPSAHDFSLYGLAAWAILCVSVIVHELGHCLAAWRLGGSTDLIVLGPLGGLHSPHVPREPHREVAVAMAGPAANFVVMTILGPPLLLIGKVNLGTILLEPLNPTPIFDPIPAVTVLKLAFWLNWLLVLANLLPAAPLDGGRALRSILWPVMGYRGALRTLSRSGMLVSLVLCLVALLVHEPGQSRLVPIWLPLVLLAVYLYFSARRESQRGDDEVGDDDLFGYDFSQGYTSLERPPTAPRNHRGPLRRWLEQRRQIRQRRLREMEAEEERRVDEVLIRIKQFGKESLTSEEQSLLERVSARYRNRLQS